MAVNYVKGQILSSILERDGINISIANANVGIGTSSPTTTLDVNGNIRANTLSVTGNINSSGNIVAVWLWGDGSNISNITSSYGNSNVVTLLANFGSNTLNTTGNVTAGNLLAGNIIIPSVGNISAGNVNINNLANPIVNADAATKFYVDSTIGNIGTLGNLTVSNTTITTGLTNGNITLTPTGTGLVTINTATGLVLPVGNTLQQPSLPPAGTVRYNTTTSLPEFYNGSYWSAFNAGITNQLLNGDGSTTIFTLQTSTTTAAVLIMLNGITQTPSRAYNMTPSPSTNLVFSEAPSTGDVIDIRFL